MAATTTTLVATPTALKQHAECTLVATVSAPTATGTVDFFNGATKIGTVTLNGVTGVASIARSRSLPPGANSVTAVYNGDSNWATSTSSAVVVTTTKQDFTAIPTSHPYPENDAFAPNGTLATTTRKNAAVSSGGDKTAVPASGQTVTQPNGIAITSS